MTIKKEFNVYGKTLHNVLNCSNLAADYIDFLEMENHNLKQCLMEAMEIQENFHSNNLKETYQELKQGKENE